MTPIGRIAMAGLLSLCTMALTAQERHLGTGSTNILYGRSAFAHGYIHGYEEGFHHGDLDLQLGRSPRDPSSLVAYKHPCATFHSSFGSKASFKTGFENGFLVGYSDAIRGLQFVAVDRLRTAATGLADLPQKAALPFDEGFKEGYRSGRRQGADDGRELVAADPIQPPCLGMASEYCEAFGRGFQLGYADGYGNQSANHKAARNLQASADK